MLCALGLSTYQLWNCFKTRKLAKIGVGRSAYQNFSLFVALGYMQNCSTVTIMVRNVLSEALNSANFHFLTKWGQQS